MSNIIKCSRPFKFIGALLVSLSLVIGLTACGNSKELDALKEVDTAAATLVPKLKRNMLAAIEAKTKSYTDKDAKKALAKKLAKAESAVKKLEALDKDYKANAAVAKDQKADIPDLKHLHKNEAQAYRNILKSIKNPTKETVQDKAIQSFDAVVNYKGAGKSASLQAELHKTYDSKLNDMLNARLETDKKAQQAKADAADKAKHDAEAGKQQGTQNQATAQAVPQQNSGSRQNDGGGQSNGAEPTYNGGGQSYGGGTSAGQKPYTPPSRPQAPSRPVQNQGQSQGEWEFKPSEKTDANGNYIDKYGNARVDADLSQGLVPG